MEEEEAEEASEVDVDEVLEAVGVVVVEVMAKTEVDTSAASAKRFTDGFF